MSGIFTFKTGSKYCYVSNYLKNKSAYILHKSARILLSVNEGWVGQET